MRKVSPAVVRLLLQVTCAAKDVECTDLEIFKAQFTATDASKSRMSFTR